METKSEEKDTTGKRMWTGFKIMCSKIKAGYTKVVDSETVQNIKAQNESSSSGKEESILPKGFYEDAAKDNFFSMPDMKITDKDIL